MSLYQPIKEGTKSRIWWMDFHYQGQRIRESTGMTSKTRAREVELKRKQGLRDGSAGFTKPKRSPMLPVAAEAWMAAKKARWSPRMLGIAENSLKHLNPVLGKKLLVTIDAEDIQRYQKARQAEGASGRTVNIEVGCLRAIMKRSGDWARIQSHVEMLKERDDAGHALSSDEERVLLEECGKSRSRVLFPFIVLAIETAARYGTIRRLQWKNVDFANRCLTFGKDKTAAGSGRTIPLTPRAVETLQFWAGQFPGREPEHFVFPVERYGGIGAEETFGFTGGAVHDTDPAKPAGSIKRAWQAARKRAELPHLRIHDLRHTGVSRMISARTPLPIIAKIVGWSAGTLAKMSARYGHFSLDEMRSAVESISRGQVSGGYPRFSPRSEGEEKENIQ